ncbi:MAG: YdbH domain-containing protein [Pseudomonadales bacterium]
MKALRWAWRTAITLVCAVLVLAPTLALSLYVSGPFLLPTIAKWLLPPEFELIELVSERPGLSAMRLPLVHLKYAQSNGERAELRVRDTKLDYDWPSLKALRANSLSIAQAQLTLPKSYARAEDSALNEALRLNDLLPTTLLRKLPLDRFLLRELIVSAPASAELGQWRATAELLNGSFKLSASSNDDSDWRFSIHANEHNELSVLGEKGGLPVASVNMQVESSTAVDTKLTGTSELNTAELALLLHDFVLLPPELNFSGQLHSIWSVVLPASLSNIDQQNVQLSGTISGSVAGSSEKFGSLQCRAENSELAVEGQAQKLAEFSWRGDSIDISQIEIGCVGELNAELIPEGATRVGLGNHTRYQFAFTEDTKVRVNVGEQSANMDSGALSVQLSILKQSDASNSTLSGKVTLKSAKFTAARDLNPSEASLVLRASLDIPVLSLTPYVARNISVATSANVTLSGDNAEIIFERGSELSAQRVRWLNGGTSQLRIAANKAFTISKTSERIELGATKLKLSGRPVHAFGPRLDYDSLWFETQGMTVGQKGGRYSDFSGGAQLRLREFTAAHAGLTSQTMHMTIDMNAEGSRLDGTLGIKPALAANGFNLDGRFRHNIESNVGHATLATPLMSFNEQNRFLPSLVQKWPYPLDFSSGALKLDSTVEWQRGEATSAVSFAFKDLGGFYERNLFYGLNGKLHGQYQNDIVSGKTEGLKLSKLEAGVLVENISINVQPQKNAVHLLQLRADLLGGELSVNDLALDKNKAKHEFKVVLKSVDLAKLLQLESGVSGSGILDAELPMAISARGVSMSNGRSKVRAPGGIIRYLGELPQAALDTNPQLSLALNALKNFHYDVLDIESTYAENGKLTLKTKLQGRNPDSKNKRPVHFNLNVTEDIPALLKSLQLSQDISDKLDARIQQLSLPKQ